MKKVSLFLFLFFPFFWLLYTACEILVLWPGIKPVTLTLEVWSFNHWTTREVSKKAFLNDDKKKKIFRKKYKRKLKDESNETWFSELQDYVWRYFKILLLSYSGFVAYDYIFFSESNHNMSF